MAPLRYTAKFDPFLSWDCAPCPPLWRKPRRGKDQILPSGNLEILEEEEEDDSDLDFIPLPDPDLDCAPTLPPWHNPRNGRDQILPSGNLE